MVRTRRSFNSENAPPGEQNQVSKKNKLGNLPSNLFPRRAGKREVCFELLKQLLNLAPQGYWYRILPIEDVYDDISNALAVEWRFLVPLLISCGLISVEVTSVVKNFSVNRTQWDEMANAMASVIKMEVTLARCNGEAKQYYFVLGKPKFKSPLIQNRSRSNALISLPERSTERRILISNVKKASERIVNSNLVDRLLHRSRRTSNRTNTSMFITPPPEQGGEQPTCSFYEEEEQNRIISQAHQQICYALALDLQRRPRLSRTNAEEIDVRENLYADIQARHMVIHTAILWGWRDPCLAYKRRQDIAKAACRQVAYDLGYKQPLAHTQLPYWYGRLQDAITTGEDQDPVSPSQCGRQSYVQDIEDRHPGYLHTLFRYAIDVKGALASFSELAECMNEKSAVPGEQRPTLSLSRRQLGNWFKASNGREISAVEKPLLTTEHKEKRVAWARVNFDLLSDPTKPVAFLDEKWFYTVSRRNKLKILPRGSTEAEATIPTIRRPRIRSRRYPVKVMFLGVVANPQPEKNFDGRVLLERVSRQKIVGRASRNRRFTEDVLANEAISTGAWHNLVQDDTTCQEAIDLISTHYDLDEYVAERLELTYESYIGTQKKIVQLELGMTMDKLGTRTTQGGQHVDLELKDLIPYVHVRQGDEVAEDVSCDSRFMSEVMPKVGKALREAYHWLPATDKIYLVLDNAGGHGTKEAITEYTEAMRAFNVELIWQVPRSPETNILDLGVWMSIQSAVSKVQRMRRCHHEVLAKSVRDAWENMLSIRSFENVYRRLRVVLSCIVEDSGGNALVEEKRGKLFREATIEDPPEENNATDTPIDVDDLDEDVDVD